MDNESEEAWTAHGEGFAPINARSITLLDLIIQVAPLLVLLKQYICAFIVNGPG